MNILFFDVVPTNIVRFFKGIVQEFENSSLDANLFFMIEEDDHNDISYVQENYPNAISISYVFKRNLKWHKYYLTTNRIDAVLFNAQRIPDDMVILACRQLGIKTFMFQHGMYIPFLKRSISFFLKKIGKSFRYLFYSTEISKELGYGKTGLLIKYFKCYVLGCNQVNERIPREYLNVDKVYVYGNYWKQFHCSQFGYTIESQFVVGYPDLQDIYGRKFTNLERGVCYIAQTLVEDGRLNKKLQLAFFERLVSSTCDAKINLYVKLHPRSHRNLYKFANEFKHVKFYQDHLPEVSKYIGHYSTLLAKGMMISGDVCIYEYEGHPTPLYFRESASTVLTRKDNLVEWLHCTGKSKNIKIQQYFECQKNVYQNVVNDIKKTLSKGKK